MATSEIAFSIPVPAGELCAWQRGAAPRTVFIHGFSADLHTWDGVWAALGDALPALRYDLRGFGRSRGGEGASFDHAEDLAAVLDAAEIDVADLVAVSLGGAIAVNFALDHPQRVRRLVLISPGLVAWEWSEAWRSLWRPIVERARAGAMDEARRLWWQHPLFASTRASAAAPQLRDTIMRYSGAQWLADHHRPRLPDVERIHRLDTPTLLLTGERDLADFRLIATLLEASAPHLTRIDHAGLGHLLHLEDPAACAAELQRFLAA